MSGIGGLPGSVPHSTTSDRTGNTPTTSAPSKESRRSGEMPAELSGRPPQLHPSEGRSDPRRLMQIDGQRGKRAAIPLTGPTTLGACSVPATGTFSVPKSAQQTEASRTDSPVRSSTGSNTRDGSDLTRQIHLTNQAEANFRQRLADLRLDPGVPMQQALQARCSWHDAVAPSLDAYRIGDSAVLLWSKGPQAGKAYDIISLPQQVGPSAADIVKDVHENLRALSQHPSSSPQQRQLLENLVVGMFSSYFGTSDQPGWRHFRLADSELNQFLCRIDQMGVKPWLQEQARIAGCDYKFDSCQDPRDCSPA